MSGERVALAARPDSVTARLVRSLARLPTEGFHDFCVIGGLAVLCRVGALYRATSDIDTIVDDDGPAIAALRSRPAATPTTNGVSIDGTTIDIIEIAEIADPASLPDDPYDRLFVLAHRYAYDHARPLTIDVIESAGTVASADVVMASRVALVAMKLQSYPRRRGPSVAKQGSDLQDLLALLRDPDDLIAVGRELATSAYDMGPLCATLVQHLLVDDADVAAGRLRRFTSDEAEPEAIREVGEQLVAAIEREHRDG